MTAEKRLAEYRRKIEELITAINTHIVGHESATRQIVAALLTRGHVLLEGPPGTGKTLFAQIVAKLIGGEFVRIQFVPDMMPSDIIGGFDPVSRQIKLGPISKANIALVDEINRAGPKTQAAMLQIMGERAISLEGVVYPLPDPFFVLATENPIEEEGTYDLPVAQLDRFLLKIWMGFLDIKALKRLCLDSRNYYEFQKRILSEIHPAIDLRTICEIYDFVGENVSVTEEIADYATRLIYASRPQNFKECGINGEDFKDDVWIGLSDRVAPFTIETAKRVAFLKERDYIMPSDIKEIAHGVFDHRIVLTLKGRSKGKIRDLPREREFVNELLIKVTPQ